VAPVPALEVIGFDPGPNADFTLGDLDFLILAFLVRTTSTVVRRGLCRNGQIFVMIINVSNGGVEHRGQGHVRGARAN
jgi:hypothetical protein